MNRGFEAQRRLWPFTAVAIVLAASYSGWTIYSRHEYQRQAEEDAARQEADRDRKIVDLYGGDKLTILSFSASTGMVSAGQRVGLCYSVSNAAAVRIEPGIAEALRPSLNHCTEAFPKKTTVFTLTAEGKDGKTTSAALTVRVQ